ncbi:MAG: ComEC/Rec2 family competence protein [Alphaproteobacteria bacterium]
MQSLYQSYKEQERTRWSLWCPVGLGVGICSYFCLPYEPTTTAVIGSLCGTLLCAGFLLKYRKAYFTSLLIISVALGFTVAKGRTLTVATRMLKEQRRTTFTGTLLDVEQFPDKKRLIIEPIAAPELPQRVRLTTKQSLELQPGDRLRVTADLLPLSDPVSPQGYNFRRAAFFQNIGAVGRITNLTIISRESQVVALMVQRWRNWLTKELREWMPDQAGAIAAALITGDRSGILPRVRQAYADAGIDHILAISGLHLSLVAGLCFLAIRRGLCLIPPLVERYAIKKWAAGLALIVIALYLVISGFAVPAKRAFIMTGLIMIGVMLDRKAISMRSLALSATGILLIWPETLLTASFQLSFAAVIALIAAYEGGRDTAQTWSLKKSWWQKGFLYFGSILFSTFVATAATTPFTLALFNRFTLQAIIGNLLAIPLTGLWIMPASIVAVLSLMWGGSALAFKALETGLILLTEIAIRIAALPGAAIQVATPPPIFLVLICLGGLWLCLWQRPWRFWGVLPLSCAVATLFFTNPPDALIAGDGSTIAIRQGDTLLVSPGKSSSFYKELWMKELALAKTDIWDTTQLQRGRCLFIDQSRGWLSPRDIRKICQHHKVIISNGPLRKFCTSTPQRIVIDSQQLRKNGAHVFWFNASGCDYKSVRAALGDRPWGRTASVR